MKRKFGSGDNTLLQSQLGKLTEVQEKLIMRIQTKKSYEFIVDKPMDIKNTLKIEYSDKVFITDLTTEEQSSLGINMFKVYFDKTSTSPIHEHKTRSQLIHVRKGSIYDKVQKKRIESGQSFFVDKNEEHALKYIKGSEILLIYIPGIQEMV